MSFSFMSEVMSFQDRLHVFTHILVKKKKKGRKMSPRSGEESDLKQCCPRKLTHIHTQAEKTTLGRRNKFYVYY